MTTPNSDRPIVAEKSHLSNCSFCDMFVVTGAQPSRLLLATCVNSQKQARTLALQSFANALQPNNFFFKYFPAMLEALEHVEAGARRRQQHHIAPTGSDKTFLHRLVHVSSVLIRRRRADL